MDIFWVVMAGWWWLVMLAGGGILGCWWLVVNFFGCLWVVGGRSILGSGEWYWSFGLVVCSEERWQLQGNTKIL